ncbi:MAG: glutamate--tRNA ligase [Parvularculaceae bacterium]
MTGKSPTASSVITRFAPSPTGYLHIGGARTALFNWLYARGRGGKFLLRIEDTDRARHTEAAVDAIIDGLKWLGLDWDGEPVSQYAGRERHAEVARDLLAKGAAYRCYMTPTELEAAREKAREENKRFESPWREADPATAPDAPYAIRFKAPRDGETIVEDAVQGRVSFPNSALDDLIILRSDGGPTYNLAVVVDDHDMGVTHVIRGDDHLNNAARQTQIYLAMGWTVPVFAHVPLIHGSDGAKLSKRHGALGVEAYRDDGFLPEGLANYLLRLGWAHGDEEIIPYARAKEIFDLKGINKAPARLDIDKLRSVNAHYVAALSDAAFIDWAAPFVEKAGVDLDTDNRARLDRSAAFLKTRCATLADAPAAAEFLFLKRPLAIEGKTAKPLEKEGARGILAALASTLAGTEWARRRRWRPSFRTS